MRKSRLTVLAFSMLLVSGLTVGCSSHVENGTSINFSDSSPNQKQQAVVVVDTVLNTKAGPTTVGDFFKSVNKATDGDTCYKTIRMGSAYIVEFIFTDSDGNEGGDAVFEVNNGKVTGGDDVSQHLLSGDLATAYAEWMGADYSARNSGENSKAPIVSYPYAAIFAARGNVEFGSESAGARVGEAGGTHATESEAAHATVGAHAAAGK